jgi:hypothetical protein
MWAQGIERASVRLKVQLRAWEVTRSCATCTRRKARVTPSSSSTFTLVARIRT